MKEKQDLHFLGSKEPGHPLLLQRSSISTAPLGIRALLEVTSKTLLHKFLVTLWCCCMDAPLHLLPGVPGHHRDLAGLIVPPQSDSHSQRSRLQPCPCCEDLGGGFGIVLPFCIISLMHFCQGLCWAVDSCRRTSHLCEAL